MITRLDEIEEATDEHKINFIINQLSAQAAMTRVPTVGDLLRTRRKSNKELVPRCVEYNPEGILKASLGIPEGIPRDSLIPWEFLKLLKMRPAMKSQDVYCVLNVFPFF